jgi:alkane 1-monooxygenase
VAPSNLAPIALVRTVPLLFPLVFVWTAVTGALASLYAALALHLLIIVSELTVGRRWAGVPIPRLVEGSNRFEDTCPLAWCVLHIVALAAVLSFVESAELSYRQVFAVGAFFGYSINAFSAAAGHELLHCGRPLQRTAGRLLFAMMLYPHFPSVHLSAHHHWAGTDQDCQTPRPQQTIHAYLVQTLFGGPLAARTPQARALDRQLPVRALACLLFVAAPLMFAPVLSVFLIVQGIFAFLVTETINYVQHYQPSRDDPSETGVGSTHQDLNFVSRAMLLNLPLHAAHHDRPGLHYADLTPSAETETSQLGYWCSFWLVWLPPLWHSFRYNLRWRHHESRTAKRAEQVT